MAATHCLTHMRSSAAQTNWRLEASSHWLYCTVQYCNVLYSRHRWGRADMTQWLTVGLSQSWWYRGAGGGTDPGPATSQSTCLYLPVASSQHTSYQAGQTGDTSRDTSPNVSRQAGPVKTVVMMTGSPWTVTRCSCLTTHSHLSTSHGWRIVMSPLGPSDWLTDWLFPGKL